MTLDRLLLRVYANSSASIFSTSCDEILLKKKNTFTMQLQILSLSIVG